MDRPLRIAMSFWNMYKLLHPFSMPQLSQQIGAMLGAKIAEKWRQFFDDKIPRWAEVQVKNPGLMEGVNRSISSRSFSALAHVGSPNGHFALHEHALSDVVITMMKEDASLKWVFHRKAKPVTIDVGEGKVVRVPRPPYSAQAGSGPEPPPPSGKP
jgi:hypothetical protein